MKIAAKCLLAVIIALGSMSLANAQAQKKNAPAPAAPAAAAPAPAAPQPQAEAAPTPSWIARCASASRDAPLECAMEQTIVTKTGQTLVLVNIRVPGDTRSPQALILLPLGLNLAVGVRLQVDDGKPIDIPLQSCESRGCFVNAPLGADVLAAMKTGKQLKVSFQNLSKEGMTVPVQLTDFATVYEKIK